jgi:uncharacterized protein YeaO (DUF488 family)
MLLTKSVSSPIEKKDGVRILATRFRGRGLSTDRYDIWMPSLGPSEKLLRQVLAGKLAWPKFLKTYRDELFTDGRVDARNRTIKNHGQKFTLRLIKRLAEKQNVTLMCHCAEGQAQCHRHELYRVITGRLV